jgi:carbon monoxide dehydrogenase subunit G
MIDPSRVVRCLPGAELTETVDAKTYRGRVKVKVGPISTAYDGTARLTEVNEQTRTMQMVGEGREVGAAGSAKMTMVGAVVPDDGGGSSISVDASIDIAGRVMQIGRGLVESVSRQLFRQFADSVREALEQEAPAPALIASAPPIVEAADATATTSTAPPAAPPAPPSNELRLLPLLWRALIDWIRKLFGRK